MKNNKNTRPTLMEQMEKVFRHIRKCSCQTRRRYRAAMVRFVDFLAENYGIEKLRNVMARHVEDYVESLQNRNRSAAYIKSELSALRFFFDFLPDAKHPIPSNDELRIALEKRKYAGIDRSWAQEEFRNLCAECLASNRKDYVCACALAYYMGLRIHEVFRLDTAMAQKALRENTLTIKGKGGKVRCVPLEPEARAALETMLAITPRGHKLFVPDGVKAGNAQSRLENFIFCHRRNIQAEDDQRSLTFHGLRHSYALRTYEDFIYRRKMDPKTARLKVAYLLGHERDEVTNLYITGIKIRKKPHQNG